MQRDRTIRDEILQPGFAVVLVAAWLQPRGRGLSLRMCRFSGGLLQKRLMWAGDRSRIPPSLGREIAAMLHAAADPRRALLVGTGNGWRRLVALFRPEILHTARTLDLTKLVRRLHPHLPARAGFEQMARAMNLSSFLDEEKPAGTLVEEVLWKALSEADERKFDLDGLMHFAALPPRRPDFTSYDFQPSEIAAVPPGPGVYLFYDHAGVLLYVGKSRNLARRFREYFSPRARVPEKLETIWRAIHRFSLIETGSDLEATLLEQYMIEEAGPRLNVMRRVAEDAARYDVPAVPVAVVERSTRPDAAEVFFFGRGRALQVRIRPHRPAPAGLLKAVNWHLGRARAFRLTQTMRDWGKPGEVIGLRYFAAHRSHLHWVELEEGYPARVLVATIMTAARRRLMGETPPGPYRPSPGVPF